MGIKSHYYATHKHVLLFQEKISLYNLTVWTYTDIVSLPTQTYFGGRFSLPEPEAQNDFCDVEHYKPITA